MIGSGFGLGGRRGSGCVLEKRDDDDLLVDVGWGAVGWSDVESGGPCIDCCGEGVIGCGGVIGCDDGWYP